MSKTSQRQKKSRAKNFKSKTSQGQKKGKSKTSQGQNLSRVKPVKGNTSLEKRDKRTFLHITSSAYLYQDQCNMHPINIFPGIYLELNKPLSTWTHAQLMRLFNM